MVTGSAAFVGSQTCKALETTGHGPVVVDNLRTRHRRAVQYDSFEHGDILETGRVAALLKVHEIEAALFVALAHVGDSIFDPDIYYLIKRQGTLSFLDAMRLAGA